ncbi:hypothetical protein ACFWPP_17840 [Streptomyces anulatus]|uniref:hypothetical protein n=1 Tax=Streptomyces anulatus TaxID=1892 RepID=UPI00364E9C86
MTEAWAAIIAAVIAGVLTMVGGHMGFRAGRQQVRDQAQVEHEQWLRGQRQEAYADFLAVWDAAYAALKQEVTRTAEHWETMATNDLDVDFDEDDLNHAHAVADVTMRSMRAPQERVLLLGPERVDHAVERIGRALHVLQDAFVDHLAPIAVSRPAVRWTEAVEAMEEARTGMLAVMRSEVRSAPDLAKPARRALTDRGDPARLSTSPVPGRAGRRAVTRPRWARN